MELAIEIWDSIRPYLIKMVSDAILSAILWILLWLFKLLTSVFSIEGWASEWIKNIHSMGAVLAFSAFAILFILDVIKLHSKETRV